MITGAMRRFAVLLFLPVILLSFAVAARAAAPPITAQKPDAPIVVPRPPEMIPAPISVADLPPVARAENGGPAADACSSATPLNLTFETPGDGGATLTNVFTEEATDPVFSCMWGVPTNPRGYRTAWYAYSAVETGLVTITTAGTDYDTVMAVYQGACESLQQLACSDDFPGFQSQITFPVVRGQTYIIEVADYHAGIGQATTLNFSALIDSAPSLWRQATNSPLGGITRHALVSNGVDMYVIGGQTNLLAVPTLSNRLQRYNTELNQWVTLADIPGAGVSNTTATRLGNRIYVPGGFNGNTTRYDGTHYVYDITSDIWQTAAAIPVGLLPGGNTFAWASAAAAPNETSYYLTGGVASQPAIDADGSVMNQVYRYIPASNQWTAVQAMTTPRFAHTAAWIARANRGLCVAGGLSTGVNDDDEPVVVLLTSGECYNPAAGGGWQATGPLNFPRYSAGSAIGPDGNWYVFGGMDATGAVPETEVYDPLSNSWQLLSSAYSLGGMPTNPARVWPRGAFWGDTLWVFGGNDFPERRVISSVEAMSLTGTTVPLAFRTRLPLVANRTAEAFLNYAIAAPVNLTIQGNFSESTQFFNPYFFDWGAFSRMWITLSNIPSDSNFSFSVYNSQKVLLGRSNTVNFGGPKTVDLTITPGRYYVVVERHFPKDLPDPRDFYNLLISTN